MRLPVLDSGLRAVYAHHPRRWQDFHYVYPVVSRRSGGLSIGVNLNIDKVCNFDCIYCCVDRSVDPVRRDVDLTQLGEELDRMIDLAVSGKLWLEEPFSQVPTEQRRINDVAFSGDGEPTAYPRFDEACRLAVERKATHGLRDVKIVVITNATLFDRPVVQRGLELLDANDGEVWAKLDAGSEAYYQRVDRTKFPFQKLLDNILDCGRRWPIVIQSLFMTIHSQPVPDEEYAAYLDRLEELVRGGCRIKLVQLYTTARHTAERYVSPLSNRRLDEMADKLRSRFSQQSGLEKLAVEVYYGVTGGVEG